MTVNTTTEPVDLASVNFTGWSQEQILDFMQTQIANVKAGVEQEKERLRKQYKEALQVAAEHGVAYGKPTDTTGWAGYKMRGEIVVVAGEAYNANLTLTHITRKAEIVAAKAAAEVAAAQAATEAADAE